MTKRQDSLQIDFLFKWLNQSFLGFSLCMCVCCVCVCVCTQSLSCVQFFVTPWTLACQAPLSMKLSRQEYWSGLPCPPLRDLPDPGGQSVSCLLH